MIRKAGVLIVALLIAVTAVPIVVMAQDKPAAEPPAAGEGKDPGAPPAKKGICFAPNDNASKAFWRAKCDSDAEAQGYAHGVIMPCESTVAAGEDALVVCACKAVEEPVQGPKVRAYACVGVPHAN